MLHWLGRSFQHPLTGSWAWYSPSVWTWRRSNPAFCVSHTPPTWQRICSYPRRTPSCESLAQHPLPCKICCLSSFQSQCGLKPRVLRLAPMRPREQHDFSKFQHRLTELKIISKMSCSSSACRTLHSRQDTGVRLSPLTALDSNVSFVTRNDVTMWNENQK